MSNTIIKKCPKCGLETEFYKNCGYCKKCNAAKAKEWVRNNPEKSYLNQRDSYDKTLYGLPKGSREKMIQDQCGKCAICGQVPTTRRGLHIDHDHETGQIRKLLCHGCNTAIGLFGEDSELLHKAAEYLSSFEK